MKKFDTSLFVVSLLSLFVFISRTLPHQPNLTPVLALCLLSGFVAKGKWYSMVLPMLALALSDAYIGFYPGWALNYITLVAIVFMGVFLKHRLLNFLGFGFAAAVMFFLVSNFGVWLTSQMYPPTLDGLLLCYKMGIEFFRSTLAGTSFFMALFYGAYHFYNSYVLEEVKA